MTREVRLTPDAAAKLVRLEQALEDLGITPDQARALLLAQSVAEDLTEILEASPESPFDVQQEARGLMVEWQEDGREAWADVLQEVPQFLDNELHEQD